MRIAVVKPDYGIVGGFELVLRRLTTELTSRGHQVEWASVDVPSLPRTAFGVCVPEDVWHAAPEFFRYLAMVDAFERLDTSSCDAVISTQPPSFAVHHPCHLTIFYHHLRIYYDLAEIYVASGQAGDRELFEAARERVRTVDRRLLDRPGAILAPSETVRRRLREFNGLDSNVGLYLAGAGVGSTGAHSPDNSTFEQPICVSRHEFPKRTELFVHAMKLLPELTGTAVGGGGRLGYVQSLDTRLAQPGVDLEALDAEDLWLTPHDVPLLPPTAESNVRFVGHIPDEDLDRLYAQALCVVAPAYMEDYGLTAIEAMQRGKPVVVCRDGGGLVEFVDHGVNGFVVDPTGPAIAEAVALLRDDPGLARKLGMAARETASEFTWERAVSQVEDSLATVCA